MGHSHSPKKGALFEVAEAENTRKGTTERGLDKGKTHVCGPQDWRQAVQGSGG